MDEPKFESSEWSGHPVASEVAERIRSVIGAAEAAAGAVRHEAEQAPAAERPAPPPPRAEPEPEPQPKAEPEPAPEAEVEEPEPAKDEAPEAKEAAPPLRVAETEEEEVSASNITDLLARPAERTRAEE